jgi:hypothetical protein
MPLTNTVASLTDTALPFVTTAPSGRTAPIAPDERFRDSVVAHAIAKSAIRMCFPRYRSGKDRVT